MFKSLVYAVNALPLAGKLTIRPFVYNYWNATTTEKKVFAFVQLVLLLLFFLVAHGSQAMMGLHACDLTENLFLDVLFTSYVLVNLAVMIAQTHLLIRAIRHLFRGLPKTARKFVSMDSRSTLIHFFATIIGQMIFVVAYQLVQR